MTRFSDLAESRLARLEALLAVANHPRTSPEEARTALAGARKVAERAGVADDYVFRFAAIEMSIALTAVGSAWATFAASTEKVHRP